MNKIKCPTCGKIMRLDDKDYFQKQTTFYWECDNCGTSVIESIIDNVVVQSTVTDKDENSYIVQGKIGGLF